METNDKWNQLINAKVLAQQKLSDFAVEKLIEGKYVPKSYCTPLPLFGGNSAVTLHTIMKIVTREFLKRNPLFKTLPGVKVTSRHMFMPLVVPERVIDRYLQMVTGKMVSARVDLTFWPEQRTDHIYNYTTPRTTSSSYISVFLHRRDTDFSGNNPYNLFFLIEDFIKILETLSKRILITQESNAQPFYENP